MVVVLLLTEPALVMKFCEDSPPPGTQSVPSHVYANALFVFVPHAPAVISSQALSQTPLLMSTPAAVRRDVSVSSFVAYPLDAFVDTVRSWHAWLKVFADVTVANGTVVVVVSGPASVPKTVSHVVLATA